ncbi:hypothetical protein BD626DRAFT_512126 [Schizophyllum amplum]|uniref:Uncharacterized protein n=1 Tax=Schizophyllum amplum TaxID=97359 RepID=A0A550C0L4_9AGAR|nr:hypothetical protein BD626DRAFT_512126 [Auriculariopsis ampla]
MGLQMGVNWAWGLPIHLDASVLPARSPSPSAFCYAAPRSPLRSHSILFLSPFSPGMQVRQVTGTIEIDREEERFLGIETSFWIAVALTYLDFMEDREVSGSMDRTCSAVPPSVTPWFVREALGLFSGSEGCRPVSGAWYVAGA